jgi:hypothetical protein
MTPEEMASMKGWVDEWKIRAAFLEKVRREEIRTADPCEEIRKLAGVATMAVAREGLRQTSGLADYYEKMSRGRTR